MGDPGMVRFELVSLFLRVNFAVAIRAGSATDADHQYHHHHRYTEHHKMNWDAFN